MVLKKWDGPSRDSSDDSGSALLRPRLADSGLYLIFGPATCDQTVRSALFPAPLRYLIDSICASLRSQNPFSGPLHTLYHIAPALLCIPRLATHGLYLTSGTAYSDHISFGMRAARPSRLALHYFPHTRPPDMCIASPDLLVSSYCYLELRSSPPV